MLWYWQVPLLAHSRYTDWHCAVVVQLLPTDGRLDPPDEDVVVEMQGSLESPDELLTNPVVQAPHVNEVLLQG